MDIPLPPAKLLDEKAQNISVLLRQSLCDVHGDDEFATNTGSKL
jgi:hypothetical protein